MTFNGLSTRFFIIEALCLIPMVVVMSLYGTPVTIILISASLSTALAFLCGSILGARIDRTLRRLERAAERFARGELSTEVYPPSIPQFSALTGGLNTMAHALRERVDALTRLTGEQESILRSMAEGVITVDRQGRVIRINDAGKSFLDVSITDCSSRLVAEVVRQSELQRFITLALASPIPLSNTFIISGTTDRSVQAYSSSLRDADGGEIGILVVLQDITRLERLERVRRDFVANLSHELRTPITSIKGFVETLLDGAKEEPESLERFLRIISDHTERLQRIFSDLLTLARLEADGDDARLDVSSFPAREIVTGALQTLEHKIRARNGSVKVTIAEEMQVLANPSLLQQAITNLVDNALTYSGPEPRVEVLATKDSTSVRIVVRDNGPGIELAHQPRVFERFYRVDAGRSRSAGGTGLGLAIVKHIAQAHGGSVELESAPGSGASFAVVLPLRR